MSSIFQMQISVEWGFYQIPMYTHMYVDTGESVQFNSDHLHYITLGMGQYLIEK